MNDPGLNAPISEAQDDLGDSGTPIEQERDEEKTLLQPTEWWFASTAFPLIAGTFGPVATSFNIIALCQDWREFFSSGKTEDEGSYIKDPTWLLVVNGFSLGFAVIANIALLLNMTGRVRFSLAQPIIIAGFYLASLLLIGIVGAASSDAFRLQPASEHALTQAFYYACFAAGIYFVLATLMVVTVIGALAGKYDRKFQITDAQRTLMLQTISFMAYMLIGAAIFSSIEDWTYTDSIYWADFTLLTIGIGDRFVPVTHAGRSLTFPFTFGGILAVGLIIGSIRSMLLDQGAQKLQARTTENKREDIYSLEDAKHGNGVANRLMPRRRKRRNVAAGMPEKGRRRQEFHAMRIIKNRAHTMMRYKALSISLFNASCLWFLGALVFWYTEYKQDWTYFVALYFSWTSLITLGYGDLQPLSNSGKAFFVFWSLLAIPTLTVLISDMGDTIIKMVSDATNYIGALTIAPGDRDFFERVQKRINHLKKGKLRIEDEKPGNGVQNDVISKKHCEDENRRGGVMEMLKARLSDSDKESVHRFAHDHAAGLGSALQRDRAFYHYVLQKEISALFNDSKLSPPKQYTYDEWAYFLKLSGFDEADSSEHTTAYNKPKRDNEDAPQVGRIVAHDGSPRKWSWLGLRSPLMSTMTEAEWIIARLTQVMGQELAINLRVRPKSDERPPVSLRDLLAELDKDRETGSGSTGSSDEDSPVDVEKKIWDNESGY